MELQIKQLQNQLNFYQINGEIVASVKKGLLINAQINLIANGTVIDTIKSKYIMSTNNSRSLGIEAYEKGEEITSLRMKMIDFLCKRGKYYIRCLIFEIGGKSIELISNLVTTNGKSVSFTYEGKPSKVLIPEGKYKLEVWGAQGGDSTGIRLNGIAPSKGGLGGYSTGLLNLNEKEIIYVFVGGQGKPSESSDGAETKGGFPDGGGTKTGHKSGATSVPGTGGGSTSTRISSDSDYSRVIVAGGGGGASNDSHNTCNGGCGGGQDGGNGVYYDKQFMQGAGTQIGSSCCRGYALDGDSGTFGHGANNKYSSGCDCGGGGGGGWYGGGSGGYGHFNACSSGGRGSGWVFTESTFNFWKSGDHKNSEKFKLKKEHYLTNAFSTNGENNFPSIDGNGKGKGHSGNGFAKITLA